MWDFTDRVQAFHLLGDFYPEGASGVPTELGQFLSGECWGWPNFIPQDVEGMIIRGPAIILVRLHASRLYFSRWCFSGPFRMLVCAEFLHASPVLHSGSSFFHCLTQGCLHPKSPWKPTTIVGYPTLLMGPGQGYLYRERWHTGMILFVVSRQQYIL